MRDPEPVLICFIICLLLGALVGCVAGYHINANNNEAEIDMTRALMGCPTSEVPYKP